MEIFHYTMYLFYNLTPFKLSLISWYSLSDMNTRIEDLYGLLLLNVTQNNCISTNMISFRLLRIFLITNRYESN